MEEWIIHWKVFVSFSYVWTRVFSWVIFNIVHRNLVLCLAMGYNTAWRRNRSTCYSSFSDFCRVYFKYWKYVIVFFAIYFVFHWKPFIDEDLMKTKISSDQSLYLFTILPGVILTSIGFFGCSGAITQIQCLWFSVSTT